MKHAQKQLSPSETNNLRSEVYRYFNSLGDHEFSLGLQRSLPTWDGQNPADLITSIKAEIESHRKQHVAVRDGAVDTEWKAAYAESDDAAQRELLSGCSTLAEVEGLEDEVSELQRQIAEKKADLQRDVDEWNQIPETAERLRNRLATVESERSAVSDRDELVKAFQTHYRLSIESANPGHGQNAAYVANLLAQRELILPTLDAVEAETKAELEKLKKRTAELARKHKLTPHAI